MSKKHIIVLSLVLIAGTAYAGLRYRTIAEPPPHYTIGVVRTPPALDPVWESFRARMEVLGYTEGKNVTYRITEIGADYPETKRKIAALFDEGIDLIYPLGGLAVRAAKEITEERGLGTPIVFGIVADPIGAGLIKDYKSSGNNLTGVVSANEIVSSKRLELLREMLPDTRRAVIVWNDPNTSGIAQLRDTAGTLGVALVEKRVANVAEFDMFLGDFSFQPGDVLFRATDNIAATRVRQMIDLGRRKRIPVIGTNSVDAEQGALMGYGPNFAKMGEQGARIVHRLLNDRVAPAEIPVELPEAFDLVVNLRIARELGRAIPPAFLAKADRVIE